MAAEKNPKKPQEPRSDDEPRSHTPQGNGTLKIRVFASEGKDAHDVVRRVTVTATGPQEATVKLTIPGVTNDHGEVVLEVPAGKWQVTATAFGETDTSEWEEVRPRCETCVDLVLDINLHVSTEVVTDATGGDARFHRAGTLILATAECAPSDSATPECGLRVGGQCWKHSRRGSEGDGQGDPHRHVRRARPPQHRASR